MTLARALARLEGEASWRGRIVRWEVLPANAGAWAEFPPDLPAELRAALEARGLRRLYAHQAEAYAHARAGRGFVAATPTASGKTLCYNLPVLAACLTGGATALYLFPTKALSQDQVAELTATVARLRRPPVVFTYDGDTPPALRRKLRDRGDIVVTNPYMLHTGILPHHPKWSTFFRRLRYVVVDEVHVYKGVFGGHMANVLRRLVRLARHHGADPVFLLASATVRNPGEVAARLVGRELPVLTRTGAPRGAKHFLVLNPPLLHGPSGLRRSALDEARHLARELLGVRTIFFVRTRNRVEVLTRYLKELCVRRGRDPERVAAYRGGYLPELRRTLEAALRAGELDWVVATNALELGVDIGSLEAAVLVGYPGTLASTWQQAGRAGRRRNDAAVFLILGPGVMDQYLADHPDYLLATPRERAVLDPDNLVVRANHLKCAAFELPWRREETFGGGKVSTRELLGQLARAGLVTFVGDRYVWTADVYPAAGVSLTAADLDNVVIHETTTGRALGEVDRARVLVSLYEGAVYGHQGRTYQVTRLDYEGRRAYVTPVEVDYYTEAQLTTDLRVTDVAARRTPAPGTTSGWGSVAVRTTAAVYKKLRFYTGENLGAGEIHLPPEEMETTAWWLSFTRAVAAAAGLYEPAGAGGLRALVHALRGVAPLFLGCDPADLRAAAYVVPPVGGEPTVYLYDGVPGGVGLAAALFADEEEILRAARERLAGCPCPRGCPACAGPPAGPGETAKAVAGKLLAAALGAAVEA